MKMERKTNDVRLPAIQIKSKDSSKALSNTMPEHANKFRASLNKVDNLEKNLFSKLDAYETAARKSKHKRISHKQKSAQNPVSASTELEGYEILQKLKPGLYNRFLQAKKCIGSINMTPSTIQTATSYKSQANISTKQERSASQNCWREEKQVSVFVTAKEPKEQQIKMDISEQEMNQLFQAYIKKEKIDLGPVQTSTEQLSNLGQSIAICEKEIFELTKSMQGLLRQLQVQCVTSMQQMDAQ